MQKWNRFWPIIDVRKWLKRTNKKKTYLNKLTFYPNNKLNKPQHTFCKMTAKIVRGWRRIARWIKIQINHAYNYSNKVYRNQNIFYFQSFPPAKLISAVATIRIRNTLIISKIKLKPRNHTNIPTPNIPARILIILNPVRYIYKQLRGCFSERSPSQYPSNHCPIFWETAPFHIDFPIRRIHIDRPA